MREPLRCFLLLLLVATPSALAHNEDGSVDDAAYVEDPEQHAPETGYTGPGREPYLSFFNGAWLYGTASASPLGDQVPRDMTGAGDWLVWEDAARSDIYAYNIPAGNGLYITSDAFVQRNPVITGNVVLWEDYRGGEARIYAYFLDTAETRRISDGPGNHRNPSAYGTLVAWEDDRNGTRDIWAARLDGTAPFPIHEGPDRESDPLVLDEVVYYRTYRFNVWDIRAHDVRTNDTWEITSDVSINHAPFTNGRDVYFLTQYFSAWELDRYDVRRERVFETPLKFQDATRKSIENDRMLVTVQDLGGVVQLVARNLTNGASTHVTGSLRLVTDPHLQDNVAYAAVATRNGTSLLALKISEFAWGTQPQLTITSPGRIAPWLEPVTVRGFLTTGPGWTEPATFTVTVNGGAPQVIAPARQWATTLDPRGFDPGVYSVSVRATFREGPPVTAGFSLLIPFPEDTVDVEQAGPAYHAARALATFNQYIGNNPAAYLIIPLILLAAALIVMRLWLVLRDRRDRFVAEYVPPDGET